MSRRNGEGITIAVVAMYALILILNLTWIGALIWALIYVVLHIGEWVS